MSHSLHEITQVIGRAQFVNDAHKAIVQFMTEHPEHRDRLEVTECSGALLRYGGRYVSFELRTTSSKLGFTGDKSQVCGIEYQRWMSSKDEISKLLNAVIRVLER